MSGGSTVYELLQTTKTNFENLWVKQVFKNNNNYNPFQSSSSLCHPSFFLCLLRYLYMYLLRGTQWRFPPSHWKHFLGYPEYFRSLQMHSKRRHKICICSVILGQPESFPNYKGLSIIFPQILDAIWHDTKEGHFLIPRSIAFFNSKILGFLFSTKNSITSAVKCEKLNLTKLCGIYYISLENCTWKKQSSRNF